MPGIVPATGWKILTSHLVSEVDESDCFQSQQVQRAVHIQRSHLRGELIRIDMIIWLQVEAVMKRCSAPAGGARGAPAPTFFRGMVWIHSMLFTSNTSTAFSLYTDK